MIRLAGAWWRSCILHLVLLAQLQHNVTSPVYRRSLYWKKKKKNSRNFSRRTDLGNLTQTHTQLARICMLPHGSRLICSSLKGHIIGSAACRWPCFCGVISIAHQLLKAVSVGGLGSVAYHNCSSTAESTAESTTESTAESAATSTAVSAGISSGCTVSWAPTCGSSRCGLP